MGLPVVPPNTKIMSPVAVAWPPPAMSSSPISQKGSLRVPVPVQAFELSTYQTTLVTLIVRVPISVRLSPSFRV